MVYWASVGDCGRGLGLGLVLVLGIGMGGCSDASGPGEQPIRLSATMKLAADSLTVTLRVTNVSDTTQVLEWRGCPGNHPANIVAVHPHGLTVRPKGASYDMPVEAKVPAGPVDLMATLR